ncbi:hypothetical protein NC652_007818 [Populus alba x Populus x berolinensis]|nr:hypothetical protein NC652_007818 [Populus alba x Populus x berolinensis]
MASTDRPPVSRLSNPHTKPTHLPQPSTSHKPSSNPPQISSLLPSIRTTNPLPPHSGSWAERVRVTDTSTRFSLDPIPRQECGARLKIPAELLSESADKWNRCMVGFSLGFKMNFHMVNTIATRAWKRYGLEDVMTTAGGFMIFRFNTVDDMQGVLEKGPWMFGGKAIILQQWHPHLSKSGLSLSASMVGRPLSCDEQTFNNTRLDFARVCVEIDAALPLIHEFEIETPLSAEPILIKVEYEWKPSRCSKCCLFGHVCPETGVTEPAQKNPKTIPTEALPFADAGKNNDSGNIAKGTNKSLQENTLVVDAGNITNEVHYTVAARKNKARASGSNGPLLTQLTEQIDSRQDHLPKTPMEQLHIVPFNNKNYHVESHLDNKGEEGESDNDPTHDYQLIEENQLLITGFDRCVESKMASLKSASEASSSANASSTFIGCWNIWGLNNPKKHRFISEWVHNSKLGIIGLLETKVAPSNLDTVIAGLNLHSWSFISNANVSPTCRILVGWDTKIVKISCLHYTDQWLTCEVTSLASKEISRFTFVYGHNTPAGRGLIWEYIVQHAPLFSSSPWALMGDFNATIQPLDRSGGNLHWHGHHEDFDRCIHEAELIQIPYSRLKFSWHNGQTGRDTIMRKLDWIFCNPAFLNTWPAAQSKFLPRDASDHSAMILDFSHHGPQGPAPFKFLNLWADIEDFLDIVQAV